MILEKEEDADMVGEPPPSRLLFCNYLAPLTVTPPIAITEATTLPILTSNSHNLKLLTQHHPPLAEVHETCSQPILKHLPPLQLLPSTRRKQSVNYSPTLLPGLWCISAGYGKRIRKQQRRLLSNVPRGERGCSLKAITDQVRGIEEREVQGKEQQGWRRR